MKTSDKSSQSTVWSAGQPQSFQKKLLKALSLPQKMAGHLLKNILKIYFLPSHPGINLVQIDKDPPAQAAF